MKGVFRLVKLFQLKSCRAILPRCFSAADKEAAEPAAGKLRSMKCVCVTFRHSHADAIHAATAAAGRRTFNWSSFIRSLVSCASGRAQARRRPFAAAHPFGAVQFSSPPGSSPIVGSSVGWLDLFRGQLAGRLCSPKRSTNRLCERTSLSRADGQPSNESFLQLAARGSGGGGKV